VHDLREKARAQSLKTADYKKRWETLSERLQDMSLALDGKVLTKFEQGQLEQLKKEVSLALKKWGGSKSALYKLQQRIDALEDSSKPSDVFDPRKRCEFLLLFQLSASEPDKCFILQQSWRRRAGSQSRFSSLPETLHATASGKRNRGGSSTVPYLHRGTGEK